MIQIGQMKCPVGHGEKEPYQKALKLLRMNPSQVKEVKIWKRSVDARKKPELYFVYTMLVDTGLSEKQEAQLVKKLRNKNITVAKLPVYRWPDSGSKAMAHRPVIVGFGPAGMLCGLMLAKAGYQPLILERGQMVEERMKTVEHFFATGQLNPESNVQFGEGGAGTFSDGKLNTMVKDPEGRGAHILNLFVEAGAPADITYVNKPHIGTDVLVDVVTNIRKQIIALGGEIRFQTKLVDLVTEGDQLVSVIAEHKGEREEIPCDLCVLAIGHSARDTFELLEGKAVYMEAKSFAVGVRIEHPQSMINESQYGAAAVKGLGAADYKLTHRCSNGRGVYSFCMCPGGQVVNASSEPERLTVNGMSYRARDGRNANSAMIVTVTPEDYPDDTVLGGMHLQRNIEHAAYVRGQGGIPTQLFGDFCENRASSGPGEVIPDHKGAETWTNLRGILPEPVEEALMEGIHAFDHKIKGFGRADAVLSGVEARTSSPVKIFRDEAMMCNIRGLFPCGEGPGYAGGIMSAAMDGCRVAEKIARVYAPVVK